MIWATQHEKPGAAEKLIIWLYETLTQKKIKKIQGEFTDFYTDERHCLNSSVLDFSKSNFQIFKLSKISDSAPVIC